MLAEKLFGLRLAQFHNNFQHKIFGFEAQRETKDYITKSCRAMVRIGRKEACETQMIRRKAGEYFPEVFLHQNTFIFRKWQSHAGEISLETDLSSVRARPESTDLE
ncbi:hypothetical protein ACFX15_007934 [Malus domestica]